MPLDEAIRVRISQKLKDDLQRIADAEHRTLSNLAHKILLEYSDRAHAAALNDSTPPLKYQQQQPPARSKLPPGKRGIAKKAEN